MVRKEASRIAGLSALSPPGGELPQGRSQEHDYLHAAERVLLEAGRPVHASELVEVGLENGWLESGSRTPVTAMRARLAVNIRRNGQTSRFARVAPSTFALRAWGLPEYDARHCERLACWDGRDVTAGLPSEGFISARRPGLEGVLRALPVCIVERGRAEASEDWRQLVSYVVCETDRGEVLTYERGAGAASGLAGSLCIGFGGHVNSGDLAMLLGPVFGHGRIAAWRELREELKYIELSDLQWGGVVIDSGTPTSRRHVGLVFRARVMSGSTRATDLTIRSLRPLSWAQLMAQRGRLETWSRHIVEAFQ